MKRIKRRLLNLIGVAAILVLAALAPIEARADFHPGDYLDTPALISGAFQSKLEMIFIGFPLVMIVVALIGALIIAIRLIGFTSDVGSMIGRGVNSSFRSRY